MPQKTVIALDKANLYSIALMCFFIVYPAVQSLVMNLDGAGRLLLLASIASLPVIFFNIKFLMRDPLYVLLMVLTFYMVINGILHGSPKDFWDMMRTIYPFIYLSLIYVNAAYNYSRTLFYLAASLSVSVLLMVTLDSASALVELDGRFGSTFNANDIGLSASCTVAMLMLYKSKSPLVRLLSIASLVVCMLAIFMSECRTAFGMVALLVFAYFFKNAVNTSKRAQYQLIYIAVAAAVIMGGWMAVKSTSLGQRLTSTSTQAETANYSTGTFWDIMGDRGLQYVEAAPYIVSNQPFGIGLGTWRGYSPRDLAFHSEFLVQICENGIIGFTMYMTFLIGLLVRIMRTRNRTKPLNGAFYYFMAIFASIIFIDFMFWTYEKMYIYALYGIMLSKTFYDNPPRKYIRFENSGTDADNRQ